MLHMGQVLFRDAEQNHNVGPVLIRNTENNHHFGHVLIRDTEQNYHKSQVLIRNSEQNYHLEKLLWLNGAIILFLSTFLSSMGASGPQIFCLHCTASSIPQCYNDWMRAGGGLKYTKISKSTTGFELATECSEVHVRSIDVTLLSLAVQYCLHAVYFITHNFSSYSTVNTSLHYTRQRLPETLNTAHSTPDHLAASQAHVLYGSADWQGARMMDDWDLWFQFSRVPIVLVYRSISLYEKCHQ